MAWSRQNPSVTLPHEAMREIAGFLRFNDASQLRDVNRAFYRHFTRLCVSVMKLEREQMVGKFTHRIMSGWDAAIRLIYNRMGQERKAVTRDDWLRTHYATLDKWRGLNREERELWADRALRHIDMVNVSQWFFRYGAGEPTTDPVD